MTAHELVLDDGSRVTIEPGRSVRELLGERLAPEALAVAVGGALVDLDAEPPGGGPTEMVLPGARRAAELAQRTAAHVLQLALFRGYEQVEAAAVGVSPDGFWVDVDLTATLSPDDFPALESAVAALVTAALPVERVMLDAEAARAELRRQRSRFRIELLEDELGAPDPPPSLPFVRLGEVSEPTEGARMASTGSLGLIKLHAVAGAYFKGDETRPMLQRIWGGAYHDEAAYQAYVERREQAKARDHRKLGPRLGLFALVPEAPALPFWLPKGVTLLGLLESYLRRATSAAGYHEVRTPELLPDVHWRTSGHWDHYRKRMFVTGDGEQQLAVRPMNCPGAILVYKRLERSYRDLPLRIMEFGRVHRNERKGTLHGLLRVREFTQDDCHVFCAEQDLTDELVRIMGLLQSVYRDLGFDDYRVELSTRPPGALGSERAWRVAEESLATALQRAGIEADTERGHGAFYGPKVDVHLEDCLGREWQCGTIQVDFALPERFDLGYVAPEGRTRRPVMIHRAILGSLERFVGVLVEHTAGELPLWLAPEQVRVLPVAEASHGSAAESVAAALRSRDIRATSDTRSRTLAERVRQSRSERVPLVLVVGDDELRERKVRVRAGDEDRGAVAVQEFIESHDWHGPLAAPAPVDPFAEVSR